MVGSYATQIEVEQVVVACGLLGVQWRRNAMWKALFQVLRCTGIRISEALTLTWQDYQNDTIAVKRSKVSKPLLDRLPLSVDARRDLEYYRLAVGASHSSPRRIFPVSRQAADLTLKKACKLAGIRSLHCHLLRHGFAHHILSQRQGPAGETLALLKRAMGHAKLETTAQYLKPTEEDVAEMIRHITFQ